MMPSPNEPIDLDDPGRLGEAHSNAAKPHTQNHHNDESNPEYAGTRAKEVSSHTTPIAFKQMCHEVGESCRRWQQWPSKKLIK